MTGEVMGQRRPTRQQLDGSSATKTAVHRVDLRRSILDSDGLLRKGWRRDRGIVLVKFEPDKEIIPANRLFPPVSVTPPQLGFTISGNAMRFTWPADHIGWRLVAQTNSIGAGLGPTWTTVPDSTATNQIFVPINPANGSAFFPPRLSVSRKPQGFRVLPLASVGFCAASETAAKEREKAVVGTERGDQQKIPIRGAHSAGGYRAETLVAGQERRGYGTDAGSFDSYSAA